MLTVWIVCMCLLNSVCANITHDETSISTEVENSTQIIDSANDELVNLTEDPDECQAPDISLTLTSNEINVTWILIDNVVVYDLTIEAKKPRYESPDHCSRDTTLINKTFNQNDTLSYTYSNAWPAFIYNISIQVICNDTNNDTNSREASTEATIPDPPTNLQIGSIESNSAYVTWNPPCKINDKELIGFQIEINGVYSENSSVVDHKIFNNISKNEVNYKIENLIPSSKYTLTIEAKTEFGKSNKSEEKEFPTLIDEPGAPILQVVTMTDNDEISINWNKPKEPRGKLTGYEILIDPKKRNYSNDACPPAPEEPIKSINLNAEKIDYLYKDETEPNSNYDVKIRAKTEAGFGNYSDTKSITTNPKESDPIINLKENIFNPNSLEYCVYVEFNFTAPCTYSNPDGYEFELLGKRDGFKDDSGIQNGDKLSWNLKADFKYNFGIRAKALKPSTIYTTIEFLSPPGYPTFNKKFKAPIANETKKAYFIFDYQYFNNDFGDIKYIALILLHDNENLTDHMGTWKDWPEPSSGMQLTPKNWNPFDNPNQSELVWVIGSEETCQESSRICNKFLNPNWTYKLIVRILTRETWIDSEAILFTTLDEKTELDLPLGLSFGLFLPLILIAGYVYYRYRHQIVANRRKTVEPRQRSVTPNPIACKKLYDIVINEAKLEEQFDSIHSKSMALNYESIVAKLTENRRRNRYTNILPYDHNRVKLYIDEDNETPSDYVNASYVRGFSGEIEYICTQGPLRTTCNDFWKMVLQENVTVIAMVSLFVEMDKEKCWKYIPDYLQNDEYGCGIEVECLSEINLDFCCVRSLAVSREYEQLMVTHYQFLEWPDFGVPKTTKSILKFCQAVRAKVNEKADGRMIVHCSAGVGRTGTLIAIDILFQTIQNCYDIDVYNTVLNLRKQRMNMVQTKSQYIYIHKCLKDLISNNQTITSKQSLYSNEPTDVESRF